MADFDCIVIGAGPAGISAALYLLRANFSVCIVDSGDTALKKAHKIENYYGIKSISGGDLYENGKAQASALGAVFVEGQALSVDNYGDYSVTTTQGDFTAPAVIIATGSGARGAQLDGEDEFLGMGVSRCAVCDGFFFRGKSVCVVGSGEYALHEAEVLSNVCKTVTLLTNGEDAPSCGHPVITERIARIAGEDRVSSVIFENGESFETSAVFIANGKPTAADFALRMGLGYNNGAFTVNEDMETTSKGVFAAGDCVGVPKQIASAVYTGMRAGFSAIAYIKAKRNEK